MLVPLISFIFGLLVLRYAFLAYTGSPLLQQKMPGVPQRKGDGIWLVGCLLVALAFVLGIVGYFSKLNADWLRILRIVMGGFGLLVLVLRTAYGGKSTQQSKHVTVLEATLMLGKEFFLIVAIILSLIYLAMPSKTPGSYQHSAPGSTRY